MALERVKTQSQLGYEKIESENEKIERQNEKIDSTRSRPITGLSRPDYLGFEWKWLVMDKISPRERQDFTNHGKCLSSVNYASSRVFKKFPMEIPISDGN